MRNEQLEQKKLIKENWSQELVSGEVVNIISARWLKLWKNYVKYDDNTATLNSSNTTPLNCSTTTSTTTTTTTTTTEDSNTNSNNNNNNKNNNIQFDSAKPESIDNREIIEGNDSEGEPIISKRVTEREDYEIIPNKVWKLLVSWYQGGPEMKRKVVELGVRNELYVEVRPLLIGVKYHQTLISELSKFPPSSTSNNSTKEFLYQKSLKSSLSELREYIGRLENIDPMKLVFYNNSNSSPSVKIKPIKRDYSTLEDLKFENSNQLLLYYQPNNNYHSSSSSSSSAASSSSADQLSSHPKIMNKISKKISGIFKKKTHPGRSYSDPSHYQNGNQGGSGGASATNGGMNIRDNSSTSSTSSSNSNENSPTFEQNGSTKELIGNGKVCGLSNLGNTCFMNSSVQCLAHTAPLVEYFLSGRYLGDINKTNPLGMKGQIAEIYGKLMKDMWSGASCVAPKHLKWIIGKYAPQFSGISQQDSQELLSFLLDGLHEDLNKVLKKPYQEEKDEPKEPREDIVVANEQWDNHIKRNQSVIVNLFQGQYKSTLVCAKCSKVSITFDPYMFVTLPIPVPTERLFDVLLFRRKPQPGLEPLGPDPNGIYCLNNAMSPIKYCLKLPKREDVETLRVELSKIVGIESSCIALAETFKNRIYTFLNDQKNLISIKDKDVTIAYELPHAGDDISRIHVMHRKKNDLTLLPYVLLLNYSETTCKDLYRMVWERVGHRVKKGWKSALKQKLSKENIQLPNNNEDNENSTTTTTTTNNNNQQDILSNSEKDSHISTNDGSQFEEDDTSSVTDDETFESIYPFILKTTNGYGNHCDRCPNGCTGCPVECSDKPLHLLYKNPKYWREGCNNLTIDWRPEIIKYIDFTEHDDPNSPFTVQDKSIQLKTEFRNEITLNDCLQLYTKSEKLGTNDTWYCPQCKAHIEGSTKKLELWSAPKILVVHLKRFHYVHGHRHEKINAYVDFPMDNLDISQWVLNKANPPPIYQLYAVSNHMGGMGSGHYTSCVKNNKDQWYLISDSSYHAIDKSKVKTSDAYVLFYELKQQPSSQNASIQQIN
ncbi:hypothetical protein RB653_001150 [Dictyostelium firmibasis]|uniref:Ubiquitinyl hydrolase 1 n=1 Tax=Dictyostelium firmibasis TaxID=79012 RepID=A0AAN7YYG6_9MYCE